MEGCGVREGIPGEVTRELRKNAKIGARTFLEEKTASAKKGLETRTRLAKFSNRNDSVALA